MLEPDTKRRKGLFRYDRRLCQNEEVKQIISKTWNRERTSVEHRIFACRKAISQWNRERHVNNQVTIKREKDRLEEAMTSSANNSELIHEINQALKQAYLEEEAY